MYSWEARWARSDYLWATQGPPNSIFFLNIVAHIWKTDGYCFPLLYICLLCDEVLLPCNLRSPGFDIRPPPPRTPPPPIWIWKKNCFCHILGLNIKMYYQIVSLFDMYIDMGERIAGKQDRCSHINAQGPLNSQNKICLDILAHIWKTCFPLLYICLHCDEVCICWHFGSPGTHGFYMRAQHDPDKNKKIFSFCILFWNSKGFYHIASNWLSHAT